ncbi:capsid cement protein [Cellulomonas rhizosphaerae]|uniref:DUF2190 family protein n=1 Tax=Cellulomonas rhizosphaerae TaxID=2293719 RepID=A0A413RJH3_9CELL|nr:capsid cement protein [Cellulomonas rhizosphaerae]RHA38733.1 DUF2190 family protein [Cellulomonas rhizosphaerae]
MATNEVYKDANSIPLPVPSGVVSGEVVVVGALVGVAQTDRDADGNATVKRNGGHRVTAAAATYAAGDTIYAHASGGGAVAGGRVGLIDKTSTTGTVIGYSLEAKTLASAGSLVIVLTQV